MRLQGRFVLGACGAALACAGVATWLAAGRVERGSVAVLDRELAIGESALTRQWTLHRAEQKRAYQAIADHTYFRAYLLAGDKAQMGYFAAQARQAGADAVVVLDGGGAVLAGDGDAAGALAKAARRRSLAGGALVALDGRLADAFSLSVGADRPIGALVAARFVDAKGLAADAEPFGVEAVLAAEGASTATVPAPLADEARQALADQRAEIGAGAERRRVRVEPFGGGQLLVAAPLSRLREVSTEAGRFLVALLALVVLAIVGGALLVVDGITRPLRTLRRAAEQLGDGDFAGAAAALGGLTRRADEFGVLARAFAAATGELGGIAATCGRLTTALRGTIAVVERSAAAVASAGTRQGERLNEVAALTDPLQRGQEANAAGMTDAQSAARAVAGALTAADHAVARALGTLAQVETTVASVPSASSSRPLAVEIAGQARLLAEALRDEREAVTRGLEQVAELRKRLEDAVGGLIRERNRGATAQRGLAEVGRLAKEHAREARALQASAGELRQGLDRLDETLRRFDVDALEDGGDEDAIARAG